MKMTYNNFIQDLINKIIHYVNKKDEINLEKMVTAAEDVLLDTILLASQHSKVSIEEYLMKSVHRLTGTFQ